MVRRMRGGRCARRQHGRRKRLRAAVDDNNGGIELYVQRQVSRRARATDAPTDEEMRRDRLRDGCHVKNVKAR